MNQNFQNTLKVSRSDHQYLNGYKIQPLSSININNHFINDE